MAHFSSECENENNLIQSPSVRGRISARCSSGLIYTVWEAGVNRWSMGATLLLITPNRLTPSFPVPPSGYELCPANSSHCPCLLLLLWPSVQSSRLTSNFIRSRERVELIFHSALSSHLNNYQFYCLIKGRVKISNQFKRAFETAETVHKNRGQSCQWPEEMMSDITIPNSWHQSTQDDTTWC